MTLAEAILATTPQNVYDKLVTITPEMETWPEDTCMCPLYTYFSETFPDEGDPAIYLTEVHFGDDEYDIPDWMYSYQERMIAVKIDTMGGAVAILANLFGAEV